MEEQATSIDYEYWNLIVNIAKVLFTLVIAILAAWLAHRYWKKQKGIENRLKREEMQYASRAESCKAVWALLEFLSEKEHPKTVIVVRGTKENPEYYFRLDRAKQFIEDVPRIFYKEGHGAFMTAGVEDKMMALRSKFYGFIESTLRRDEKKKENSNQEAFKTEEGFYKMIDDRSNKMERIKNPKFREGVMDNSTYLRQYLQHQLSKEHD